MNHARLLKQLSLPMAFLALSACAKGGDSFSLLSAADTFEQQKVANNKIDIIWMVDGSGTMANHQSNLGTNFNRFISQFVSKGFDYNMVIASTDSWLREKNYNGGGCTTNPNPTNNPNMAYTSSADCNSTLAKYGDLTKFRDGDIYGAIGGAAGPRSGKYLLSSAFMSPAEVMSTFATNVRTGTRGDGSRESALQSLRSVLRRNADGSVGYSGETHTVLNTFRRDDAFLAVIIVSDEDDQSRKQVGDGAYASTQAYVDGFKQFMDGYTSSSADNKRYNVSGIVVKDINNCAYNLNGEARQGDRYMAVANATNGVVGDICSSDFSQQLDGISERIVALSTRFRLSREPYPQSISIIVNGAVVPQDATNGWTLVQEGTSFYIEFHGAGVPAQGASILVDFDPVSVQI